MTTKYIGIDPSSSSTGVCIIENNDFDIFSIRPNKKETDHHARIYQIADKIEEVIDSEAGVVVEDLSSLRSMSGEFGFADRLEILGAIKYVCLKSGGKLYCCHPKTLKMFVTGRGDSHKREIKKAILTDYNIAVRNSDEADAVGLAMIGKACFDSDVRWTLKNSQLSAIANFSQFNHF